MYGLSLLYYVKFIFDLDFLEMILEVEPTRRPSIEEIKTHAWFASTNYY